MRRTSETEGSKVELDARSIENAQHHALTEHGRHRGDAQIYVLAAHGGPDAAVLRHAALGDVEMRHDLQPRRHGRAQRQRQRLDGGEDAVDTIADAQTVRPRLDMDVGCPHFHGARDEIMHQPDDGGLACHVFQPTDVIFAGLAGFCQSGIHRDCATASIEALEGALYLSGRHDAVLDRAPQQIADGGCGIRVEGIG